MDSDQLNFVGEVAIAIAGNQRITKKMANIILQGLPGSGKTSLLDHLLNRPIRANYSSTGVSENIVIVDISPTSTLSAAHAYDDSTWKATDFVESFISQLNSGMKFLPRGSLEAGKATDFDEFFTMLKYDMKLLPRGLLDNLLVAVSSNSLHCEVIQQRGFILSSEVNKYIKTVLKEYNIKNMQDLQRTNSLYIRDTGGQVEFQESLSLLIYGPSIFVFVMKTNVDIYTKHIIQYRSPTGEVINRYKSSISTVDALLQFLTSISAIQTTEDGVFQEEDGTYLSHKPVVFIVGTHIDQLGSEADSTIDKINKDLDKIFRTHNLLDLVCYADGGLKKVMYLVDNTCDVDHNFQMLRSSINTFISNRNEFTIEYPLSYLLFCLVLPSIKETVLSMEACKDLAATFGIERSDIKSLLHFLHFRVGIIQHYDVEGLSDLIIKEPQVLFNKVTDLLVKTFISPRSLNMSEQECFSGKGILEASVFDNILSNEDKITPKQFLSFLLHLRMAIPFTDKNGVLKYFIPSVLNHVKPLSEERKTDIVPLAITFKSGHCPKGLLGMLISYLMNPEKNREIIFDLLEDNIYQDQVSLLVHSTEDMDEVCLKSHLSHLEVTIFLDNSSVVEGSDVSFGSRKNTPIKVCNGIRVILQDCLKQSLKTLHYNYKKVGPIFSLACPREGCVRLRLHHEVTIGETSCYMRCCSARNAKLPLPKTGGHWFCEGKIDTTLQT